MDLTYAQRIVWTNNWKTYRRNLLSLLWRRDKGVLEMIEGHLKLVRSFGNAQEVQGCGFWTQYSFSCCAAREWVCQQVGRSSSTVLTQTDQIYSTISLQATTTYLHNLESSDSTAQRRTPKLWWSELKVLFQTWLNQARSMPPSSEKSCITSFRVFKHSVNKSIRARRFPS